METQHTWWAKANCLDADPEMFFPVAGNNGLDAQKVCAQCTVVDECLQYAVDNEIEEGVWGGMSAAKRLRMRRQRSKAA